MGKSRAWSKALKMVLRILRVYVCTCALVTSMRMQQIFDVRKVTFCSWVFRLGACSHLLYRPIGLSRARSECKQEIAYFFFACFPIQSNGRCCCNSIDHFWQIQLQYFFSLKCLRTPFCNICACTWFLSLFDSVCYFIGCLFWSITHQIYTIIRIFHKRICMLRRYTLHTHARLFFSFFPFDFCHIQLRIFHASIVSVGRIYIRFEYVCIHWKHILFSIDLKYRRAGGGCVREWEKNRQHW